MGDKYRALLAHRLCRDTAFDEGRMCFTRPDQRRRGERASCRGLLGMLRRAFPMTEHGANDCPRCQQNAAGRSGTSRQLSAAALAGVDANMLLRARASLTPSKRRVRRGQFVPLSGGAAPHAVATPQHRCRGASSIDHGTAVDRDVSGLVRGGAIGPATDPCAIALMYHVRSLLGWKPLATQVPVYSPTLGLATAIDMLCTDAATETELYLVEVKATRVRGASPELLDRCYCTSVSTAGPSPLLRQLNMSRRLQHQLQLWTMAYMLRHDLGIVVDRAIVMRTGPGAVVDYELDPLLLQLEPELVDRLKDVGQRFGAELGSRARSGSKRTRETEA
jgi:hypothetical protein